MWPITNHKNKNAFLGTIFICLDIQVCLKNTMFLLFQLHWKLLLTTQQKQKMEGRVPISTSDKMYRRFEERKIYHIRYFNLLPNNQRYRLTVQPYIININETTIITLIQENIPPIPSYIFWSQRLPPVDQLSKCNQLPLR